MYIVCFTSSFISTFWNWLHIRLMTEALRHSIYYYSYIFGTLLLFLLTLLPCILYLICIRPRLYLPPSLNYNLSTLLSLYVSVSRCSKVLTRPRISSMCTLRSSPLCVESNWTPTTKQGICFQVHYAMVSFIYTLSVGQSSRKSNKRWRHVK